MVCYNKILHIVTHLLLITKYYVPPVSIIPIKLATKCYNMVFCFVWCKVLPASIVIEGLICKYKTLPASPHGDRLLKS